MITVSIFVLGVLQMTIITTNNVSFDLGTRTLRLGATPLVSNTDSIRYTMTPGALTIRIDMPDPIHRSGFE